MKELSEFFRGKKVKTILDVGTGTGDFIQVLKNVFPGAKITGIDPNNESLEEAKINHPDVLFEKMTGENLAFPDNFFDLVSISMALHHLPDTKVTLKEMIRVTKPDKWAIVNELYSDNLNPAQEVNKMYHHFRSTIDRIKGISHNETFKKHEIIRLVADSGIRIQFQFDNDNLSIPIIGEEDLQEKIGKMNQNLETISGFPQYYELEKQIDEFRRKYLECGFQQATRVVLVGRI